MPEVRTFDNTHKNFIEGVASLDLPSNMRKTFSTAYAYSEFGRLTRKKVSIPSLDAGRVRRESENTLTAFSKHIARRIIEHTAKDATGPTEISEAIKSWAENELKGVFPVQYNISKNELSYHQLIKENLANTEKIFNFLVENGAEATRETFEVCFSFAIKDRRKSNLATPFDYGTLLTALGIWELDKQKWIEIIRPERLNDFDRRVDIVRDQFRRTKAYREYLGSNRRLLNILHVHGAKKRTSYKDLYERIHGLGESEERIGLNRFAKEIGNHAVAIASRLALIDNVMDSNGDEEELFTDQEFHTPMEIVQYRKYVQIRELIQSKIRILISSNNEIDIERNSNFLLMKLYEEMLLQSILGITYGLDDEGTAEKYRKWFSQQICSNSFRVSESITKAFPFNYKGTATGVIRNFGAKATEMTESEFMLKGRIGAVLRERLRASQILSSEVEFKKLSEYIFSLWGMSADFREMVSQDDLAKMEDATPTAISALQAILIMEGILQNTDNEDITKDMAELLKIPPQELRDVKIAGRDDPEYMEKVSKALKLYSIIQKPRNLSSPWKDLKKEKEELILLSLELFSTNGGSDHNILFLSLFAQMQGYSSRELVRILNAPRQTKNTLYSIFSELTRVANRREISKTGRG